MALGSATVSTECCIDCVVQADNDTAIAASAMGLMVRSLECEETTGSATASATDEQSYTPLSGNTLFGRARAAQSERGPPHEAVAISD